VPGKPFPVTWLGEAAVITLPEEIDISNADQVRDELLSLVNRGPSVLIVDMAETTFCDSAGVNALVRAHKRAVANSAEIRLVVASPGVSRILNITGVDRLIPLYPTVTESLETAGPRDQARTDPEGWAAQPS
jgi:anti-sigma B factor antagonist